MFCFFHFISCCSHASWQRPSDTPPGARFFPPYPRDTTAVAAVCAHRTPPPALTRTKKKMVPRINSWNINNTLYLVCITKGTPEGCLNYAGCCCCCCCCCKRGASLRCPRASAVLRCAAHVFLAENSRRALVYCQATSQLL